MAVCFWHSFVWPGIGHLRRGHAGPAVEPAGARSDGRGQAEDGGRVRVLREARGAVLLLPRPRHRTRRRLVQGDRRATSTRWSTRRPATWSAPGSGCSGARPTSSRTHATRRAPPPTPTPRCSPTRPRRCAPRSRRPTASAARTTCCGVAGRATTRSSTPTSRAELDQLARFLHLVVEHKHRIGFEGTILIEPKPAEPTKHQYDYDAATVAGFLGRHDLERGQGQPRGQPRHARRSQLPPRGGHRDRRRGVRLGRRQPGRPAERVGHRPVPELGRGDEPRAVRDPPRGWPDDRRVQLRHEAAPPVDRPRRPVPRARRRDGHAGAGAARRRVPARVRRSRGPPPRALRRVAGGARHRDQHG